MIRRRYLVLAAAALIASSAAFAQAPAPQDLVLACAGGTVGSSVAPWVSNCPTANQAYVAPVDAAIVVADSKTGTWQKFGDLVPARLIRVCLAGSPVAGATCTAAGPNTGAVFKSKGTLTSAAAPTPAPAPPDPNTIVGRQITVSWVPPNTNVDGSPLVNIAGYHFAIQTNDGAWVEYPTDASPLVSRYVFPLSPGKYCFTIETVALADTPGGPNLFSQPSGAVCATLVAPQQPKPGPPVGFTVVFPPAPVG